MSEQWQLRRGTTAENDNFTGASGEVTMDTDTGALRVHDGVTTGGKGLVDSVVEFQKPTADNNYTWFRKYASGWVEQGGSSQGSLSGSVTVNLPVTMADTNYKFQASPDLIQNDSNVTVVFCVRAQRNNSTASSVNVIVTYRYATTNDYSDIAFDWEVKGMAA